MSSGRNVRTMDEAPADSHEHDSFTVSIDVSSIPFKLSGVGRYANNLTTQLAGRVGLSLTLLSRKGDTARWSSMSESLRVVDSFPRARLGRLLWEQLRLPALLDDLDIDVHHGIHYTLPERSSKPKVVTIHDMTFFDHPEWHIRSKVVLFRRAIKVASYTAAALICPSQMTADRLNELFRPDAPIFVAPHGVDRSVFTPDEPSMGHDKAILDLLGVREPYVAFVGTLEPRKDVPSLVRAFDLVSSGNPQLSLVIAGIAGWGTRAVEEAIAAAHHSERIIRLGHVTEEAVAALLRKAEVVAYPSIAEGFGLPALEALACGAVVVTTSGTAMAEVVGDAALLVEPRNVDDLAKAIEAVVSGAEPKNIWRERGTAKAAEYTWAKSAEIHMRAYRSALNY